MFEIIFKGFIVFGSLIAAIGAQNAFVLKQALLKQHIFWICFLCAFCDFVLINIGVFTADFLAKQAKIMMNALVILGIIFLVGYALKSLFNVYQNQYNFVLNSQKQPSKLTSVLLLTLGITLFNPHVYIDTIIIIGGVGAIYASFNEKLYYIFGASLASFVWFFALGYGARILIPLFKQNITWRILDMIIASIMLWIAYDLSKLIDY